MLTNERTSADAVQTNSYTLTKYKKKKCALVHALAVIIIMGDQRKKKINIKSFKINKIKIYIFICANDNFMCVVSARGIVFTMSEYRR